MCIRDRASTVTATLKVTGQIDAVRDGTSITLTPAYKNTLRKPDSLGTVQIYSSADQYTEPVTDLFEVRSNDNGGFVITRAEGVQLNTKLKYRAVLTNSFDGIPVTSTPVALRMILGASKITLDAQNAALYLLDKNSRADFRVFLSLIHI